jgi:hypothetical protein
MIRTARQMGLKWALPLFALLMLALMLTPADVWRAPADDAVYTGFDPNLVSTSAPKNSSVHVSTGTIDILGSPDSTPAATLATTTLRKFDAKVDVVLLSDGGSFQVGVWSPWTDTGQFVVFGAAPTDLITFDTIEKGGSGPTLIGGDVTSSTMLGHYQPGNRYRVAMSIDRNAGQVAINILGNEGTKAQASAGADRFPVILSTAQLSISASTTPGQGTGHAVLRNYSLTLPHQRSWASRVDDPTERFILLVLAVGGLLLVVFAAATHRPADAISRWLRGVSSVRVSRLAVGATALYLVGNALLFPLGGHPFDMGGEKLWAYVARAYGIAQLYYVPNFISVTTTWHGVPLIESAFPYEPVSGYLSTAIGWIASLLFSGGAPTGPGDARLEYLIKAVNVLVGLADAAVIYLIAQKIGFGRRWSAIATGLFLFNPAVWFSMSVWGQTHVFSLFFVLLAVLMAEKNLPVGAWLALIAGSLTRPQMLVFGLLLGIVFLRRFAVKQNIAALSWTVVATFLILTPLTLATSPSLPIDILLHNVQVQEAGGNQVALTTVSQDALSIWPLITYIAHGTSGLNRAFTPSAEVLVGSLTYQRLGQLLTIAALLIISSVLLFRKKAALQDGGYIPLIALGIASFLMLLTGILATHFLLALPFLLLCRRWMSATAYYFVAVVWTITTFVPMYGDMGVLISSLDYPLLHNAITSFFISLYSWDRFITVAVVANILALLWLAFLYAGSSAQRSARQTAAS